MKKLLFVFLAVVFVCGLVAQTAIAEDRLALNGQMRVRGFNKANYDFDTESDNDDKWYFDQRFRLGAVITPADGVKGVLRADFASQTWGMTAADAGGNVAGATPTVDHAYMDITKGMINLKAGLQPLALGNAVAVDYRETAFNLTLLTPVTVTLVWVKADEGGATTDDEDLGTEDMDHYALNLGYHTDAFTVNGFYAMVKDGNDDRGLEPWVFGVQGLFNVGPVAINAELNKYGGSYELADIDFVGLQAWVNASMKLSDALKVGVFLVYSDSEDEADEEKLTYLSDDGSTTYDDYGAMNTFISSLGAENVFDPGGDNAGAMGGGPFIQFSAMENLIIYGNVYYLVGSELDDTVGEYENATIFNVSVRWNFMPNAGLDVGYHYVSLSLDDDVDSDPAQGLGFRLHVDW